MRKFDKERCSGAREERYAHFREQNHLQFKALNDFITATTTDLALVK